MHLVRRPVLAIVTALALGLGVLGSAPAAQAATPGEASINAYAKRLGSKIGSPKGGFATVAQYGKTVTYRSYSKGLLVHNGSATKRVAGSMLSSYNTYGGVRGTLGAPVIAKNCNAKGNACIQRFQHGSIYRSSTAKRRVSVSRVSGERSELIAVARSQVGYKEPGYRKNKYGKFVNGGRYSNQAWCSFLMSWISSVSGNGAAIPKRKTFDSFVAAVRKRGNTTDQPAVGRLAFYDYFRDGHPSHVGLIIQVRKDTVVTIEGNIDARGASGRPRGVHKVVRPKSKIVFYATPDL
ncbi:hypothetical protein [Solicola sp. PLA-1-18]|uniref:hypothetical protein n=1 Tax=Solicola sp. PLA-1-18 TaxID=3380532 RepID=UPI003B7F587B